MPLAIKFTVADNGKVPAQPALHASSLIAQRLAHVPLLVCDIAINLPCHGENRGTSDMHAICRDFPECIPRGKLKPHTLDLAWKHQGAEAKLILPTRSCDPSHFVPHTPCCSVHHEACVSGEPGLHKLGCVSYPKMWSHGLKTRTYK
jgi:hypothetical protein